MASPRTATLPRPRAGSARRKTQQRRKAIEGGGVIAFESRETRALHGVPDFTRIGGAGAIVPDERGVEAARFHLDERHERRGPRIRRPSPDVLGCAARVRRAPFAIRRERRRQRSVRIHRCILALQLRTVERSGVETIDERIGMMALPLPVRALFPRVSAASALPAQVHVFVRDWLSSNNVLLKSRAGHVLIDSGYSRHAEFTLALLATDHGLGEAPLARLVNTHCHSDHIGGNAAIKARYGCPIAVPIVEAPIIEAWDEIALLLAYTDQYA